MSNDDFDHEHYAKYGDPHGEFPSLPTREQIAEAQHALTELGDAIALPDTQAGEDWFTERMGLVTDIFESVLALLQKGADR